MTNDLTGQLQIEILRLKIKPGRYYELRTGHLSRLLDLCESIPDLRIIMDQKFFWYYVRRLCGLLSREIRLVHRLAIGNMICILDLENLKRLFSLLKEEEPIIYDKEERFVFCNKAMGGES